MFYVPRGIREWSIRRTIATILLAVVVVNVAVDLLIQRLIIAPSFVTLEEDEAREAADRCVKIIDQEAHHLMVFTEDWSTWDDTYQFALDRNAAYATNNLTVATFRTAQLNLIYIFNTSCETVWGGVRNGGSDGEIESDTALGAELARLPAVVGQKHTAVSASGVFLSSRGPVIIAVLPILANEGRGPSRGAFVMGRFLNGPLVAALGGQAGVKLAVAPVRGAELRPEQAAALADISPSSPSVCRVKDDATQSVYVVYPDIAQQPGLLLEADVVRDITPKGALVTRYALASGFVSGVLVLVALVVALRKTVVGPIRSLTERVMNFSFGDAPVSADSMARGNEIKFLVAEFEAMKTRLAADLELRRRSEARMRALLVSAPDGIVTVATGGAIESLNPAAEAMFGYEPNEMVGKNWRALVSDTLGVFDDQKVAAAIRDRTAAVGALGYETGGVRKDGSIFPMHVTVSEVAVGDERLFLGILRDITELNRMHERVLRAEHLAAIGEMGASVAHEIKNPIAGISGAVQVLRDSMAADDSRREVIGEILEQVHRVDFTVRELLMFAKPWSPEKRPCVVMAVIQEAVARAKAQGMFRRIEFVEEGDSAVVALLDRYLVEQVIANLFQNALQAMPGGGRITCSLAAQTESVEIAIADTGVGVPEEVQDDVFRPFFTTRTRGTGLGLAVSRQIMEAHGGAISLESSPGAGTRVTLRFPTGE